MVVPFFYLELNNKDCIPRNPNTIHRAIVITLKTVKIISLEPVDKYSCFGDFCCYDISDSLDVMAGKSRCPPFCLYNSPSNYNFLSSMT